MTKQLVVGAAILDSLADPTHLLAAQRSYPPALAGLWEFPGGKRESGESPEDALHREVREELQCEIKLGPLVPPPAQRKYWELPGDNSFSLWLAELVAPSVPILGHSHQSLRWIDCNSLSSLEWLPADRQILPTLSRLLA